MKVYVVEFNIRYEGSSVIDVFRSRDSAVICVESQIPDDDKSEIREWLGPYRWNEDNDTYGRTHGDDTYWTITEHELLD